MPTDVRIDVDPRRRARRRRPRRRRRGRRPRSRPSGRPHAADDPSLDDDNADGAVGVDLALRELGATQIGEIDH